MKRLCVGLMFTLLLSALLSAQQRLAPPTVKTLPTACNVGDIVNLTTNTVGDYVCVSANIWSATPLNGGGSAGITCADTGVVFASAADVVGCDITKIAFDDATNRLLFTGGIPAMTSPVAIRGGDDGFGDAALVISNADGYIPLVFSSRPEFILSSLATFTAPLATVVIGGNLYGFTANAADPDTTADQPGVKFETGNATATANAGNFQVALGTAGGSGINGGMYINSGGLTTSILNGTLTSVMLTTTAAEFSSLPSCSEGIEGSVRAVTDSTTATWGATITGGDANHVLAYCNGTNWTVAAK